MKFALMFFAASDDALAADKYRLVLESARFADREGFASVWVPERHFTGLGGLYPNPAVLQAALATCTTSIRLNAGSVVAPLHHPLRIAEEWSVVDNLSHGRVGLSFASGWNPDDFVFFPDRYADRHAGVIETMETVRRLWRGEPFAGISGVGQPTQVRIFPRPVQAELPVWLTVAGNPRHFERAGASGANLLTHLLDQDEEVLATRIGLYRAAREAAGFDPATGIVSLMIHTLVGADAETVREQARRPYCDYIKANIGLFRGLAQSRGRDVDLSSLSPADLDEFVTFLYDRFAASRGLIGTPDSCAPLVARLERLGVTELACLLDFGPSPDLILENLPHLARLKDLEAARADAAPAGARRATTFDRAAVLARCPDMIPGVEFHRRLGAHGIQIDGAFQPGQTIWRGAGEALAELHLTSAPGDYHVHPASLDACGRVLAAALPDLGRAGAAGYLPAGFAACDLFAPLTGTVWVHAALAGPVDGAGAAIAGDVDVYDEAGGRLARLAGLRLAAIGPTTAEAGDLLYERVWEARPTATSAPDARGRWLMIADDGGVAAALGSRLEALGGTVVTTAAGGAMARDAMAGNALAGDAAHGGWRGVVYLAGLDAVTAPDADTAALDRDVARALRGAYDAVRSCGDTPIWLVTRGAVPVIDPGPMAGLAQSPLWGFGRALSVERRGALGGLIDLDPRASAAEAAADLCSALTGAAGEDMVAYRAGSRYVPRLRRAEPRPAAAGTPRFDGDRTALISGGAGGLGLQLAAWLAARGARHLLLCSRRAPDPAAETALARLRSSGVDVATLAVDVADGAALRAAVGEALSTRPPLTAVFHLAGVLDDGLVGDQTWDRVSGVLAAKVSGAWNLHRLTGRTALEHFVLFSSVSSLLPAPGQSSYAAANAFLDGLAHHRRGHGLPALAIDWGPWSEAGHAQTDYGREAHARLAALGVGAIAPPLGLRLLETLLREDRTQAAAVRVDWPRLFDADPAAAQLAFLAGFSAGATPTPADPRPTASALLDTLAGLPPDEQRPHLLQFLSDLVVEALKLRTTEPIDARQPLFDIGVDSIMALDLKDRLERTLGVRLSATLLFVRPTLAALADYILAEIVPAVPVPDDAAVPATAGDLTRLLLREIEASRGA